MVELRVSGSPEAVADTLEDRIVRSGLSVELVDRHLMSAGGGGQVVVLVFEKYFMRNSSRASLTVTVDNLNGITNVHAVGSGGGQGSLMHFDWGAGSSFEDCVEEALRGG